MRRASTGNSSRVPLQGRRTSVAAPCRRSRGQPPNVSRASRSNFEGTAAARNVKTRAAGFAYHFACRCPPLPSCSASSATWADAWTATCRSTRWPAAPGGRRSTCTGRSAAWSGRRRKPTRSGCGWTGPRRGWRRAPTAWWTSRSTADSPATRCSRAPSRAGSAAAPSATAAARAVGRRPPTARMRHAGNHRGVRSVPHALSHVARRFEQEIRSWLTPTVERKELQPQPRSSSSAASRAPRLPRTLPRGSGRHSPTRCRTALPSPAGRLSAATPTSGRA